MTACSTQNFCRSEVPRRRFPISILPKPTIYTFGEAELLDLDRRSAQVLRMRSGMFDGQLYSLREIGEEIGLSSERVRQIQSQGLALIRQVRESQRHLEYEPGMPHRKFRGRR